MHRKTIIIRGKEYRLKNDVSYYDAKKFVVVTDECKAKLHKFPNEEMLKILIPAVCPDAEINFDDMTIENERLSFAEVLILTEDLSTILNEIIDESLSGIGVDKNKTGEIQLKNGEPAIEDAISIA